MAKYRIVPRPEGGVSVEKAQRNGKWLAVAYFASREEAQTFIDLSKFRLAPRADGWVNVEKAQANGTWLAVAHFASSEGAQLFIDALARPKGPAPDRS